jgi:hypothetical protein
MLFIPRWNMTISGKQGVLYEKAKKERNLSSHKFHPLHNFGE